ncbi:CDP-alcohol phosphatidyltransferase family protein [Candidatus Latescibacterota bacterium]
MEQTGDVPVAEKKVTGFFSEPFYRAFRALFRPITRALRALGVTPNMITMASLGLGMITGVEFARGHLWNGLIFGYLMGFSDIVDGQLAKEYGMATRFGGFLDSTIDRYNEFFIFAGLGIFFYTRGEPLWVMVSAVIFANSMVISYVKARAEVAGFDCNTGRLQRPERLAIIGLAVAFEGLLLKPLLGFLAVGTLFTVLRRVWYVKGQVG